DPLAAPLGQRVGPHERPRSELVMVEEGVSELQELGAEAILAGLGVLLDQVLSLERPQEAMHCRLRQPDPLGHLPHAQPRGAGRERLEDPGRAVDGLDRRARHRAARSSAANNKAVDTAPGSWCPTLLGPKYEARPF